MNNLHRAILIAIATLAGTAAHAATFTPKFSDYAFPGTQFTVDQPANTFYAANYGITVGNSYLYKDARDTFDGVGIANGTVAEIGTRQSGRIDFIDTTNFVTIDFLAIRSTTFDAFAADGTKLDTFSAASGTGTESLQASGGKYISYLLFTSDGGYGAISGLTYNYDGKTGGGNTDLPGSPSAVPEPETYALMMAGLLAVGTIARRRQRG